MADRDRLLDEFDEESGSSGEETTFEEMQSRMSSLETMLQHARRERLNAVRHARSQLQRARVLMQRNQQTKFFLRKVISELEKSLEEYQDKPNQDPNDRTKVSLLFEGRLSKMFEDVSPLMSPGYTSPSIGSPLDSEFEVYKTPRRLSYGDELFFDEDGTSYLGNQNGSVSRNELFEYRLGNYESAGMGVPYRRHEITVHRVEIRESRSNRRKSRRDSRSKGDKSAEQGELKDSQWIERVPYEYDDVRRSTVSLRSSNYIQRPVLPQTRASRAEAASFPRSPAGSMTSPARPSKSNPRAKGSSPKNKPRAQQYDNRQMTRNKEQRNEKQPQRRLDSRSIASTAGDTVNRRGSGTHHLSVSEDKKSISFSHSVHAALVQEIIGAQKLKVRTATPNTTDPGFVPSLPGSRRSSPLVIPHGSSSASDKSRIQSGRSRLTSEDSTYPPRSTSDDHSRERRSRAISRHESTVVPPNSIEARSERSVPTSRDESSSTVPSSVDDRSRADSQWNQNFVRRGSGAVHNLADKSKALQSRVSRPDTSIAFQASSKPRDKSQTRQERGLMPQNISNKEEHPRSVIIVTPSEKSLVQTRSQPPTQTQTPRMQASATTQTIMSPVPPSGTQPPTQAQTTPRAKPPPKTPSLSLVEPHTVIQPSPPSQNIQPPQHQEQAQPQSPEQPPTSNKSQSLIRPSPPVRPPSPAQPPPVSQTPSTLTPKSQSLSQPPTEDKIPTVGQTPRDVQPQVTKQPPPRPPPPTRLPPSSATPRSSTPSPSTPPSRSATPPQIRSSISAKVSISTHLPQTKTPPPATPQSQMMSSLSMTPSPSNTPMRASLSSRPPSSARASPKPSITSRSSTGSRVLSSTRPQSIQSRKHSSPKRSPPPKSPSPPKASLAKQPALTAALIDNLRKGTNLETKFAPNSTLAQQSYQVSRSGTPSPPIRSSIHSASHRSGSGIINKIGSIGSDMSRRPSMRTSPAQERRQTMMKQETSSPTPSKLTERLSIIEAKRLSVSPAHRSSAESRSPSIKTPTGSPLSRVSKITELQKEKPRTSSPVTSEKRLTMKEARVSSVGAVEARRMYSSVSRQISPNKMSVKDEKLKSISHSPNPLNPNPRRQFMSERVISISNATRSTSNAQTFSRDITGESPVKSEGMKATKPRQSLITTRQSIMNAETSLSSPTGRRQSTQRRVSTATTPRVSSMEKRQAITTRAQKVISPADGSKRVSQVPGSDSYDAQIPGVEMLQKTIEPTPSDKRVTVSEIHTTDSTPSDRRPPERKSEASLPEKRVILSDSTSSEKRVAPIPSPPKSTDILSSDRRISLAEPTLKSVAPISTEKRSTSTGSHPKIAGPPTAQKHLSVVESRPKSEVKPSPGMPEVPLRLTSSDKNVPVSEKREIPRQAPSLVELPSGKQTQIARKSSKIPSAIATELPIRASADIQPLQPRSESVAAPQKERQSAIPTEKTSPMVYPTDATVPIAEQIKKTSSEKHIPVQHETSRKGLERKISGERMVQSKQPGLEVPEDSIIKRPHTVSAPISETKIVLEERKPLTSQSEPKELEKIPLQRFKIPQRGVEESKSVTSHSEHTSLRKLRTEMPKTTRSSLEHSSSVLSSDRQAATAKKESFSDMDAQASSSTNVAERTDTIGDLPSIKRHKYHKYHKDERVARGQGLVSPKPELTSAPGSPHQHLELPEFRPPLSLTGSTGYLSMRVQIAELALRVKPGTRMPRKVRLAWWLPGLGYYQTPGAFNPRGEVNIDSTFEVPASNLNLTPPALGSMRVVVMDADDGAALGTAAMIPYPPDENSPTLQLGKPSAEPRIKATSNPVVPLRRLDGRSIQGHIIGRWEVQDDPDPTRITTITSDEEGSESRKPYFPLLMESSDSIETVSLKENESSVPNWWRLRKEIQEVTRPLRRGHEVDSLVPWNRMDKSRLDPKESTSGIDILRGRPERMSPGEDSDAEASSAMESQPKEKRFRRRSSLDRKLRAQKGHGSQTSIKDIMGPRTMRYPSDTALSKTSEGATTPATVVPRKPDKDRSFWSMGFHGKPNNSRDTLPGGVQTTPQQPPPPAVTEQKKPKTPFPSPAQVIKPSSLQNFDLSTSKDLEERDGVAKLIVETLFQISTSKRVEETPETPPTPNASPGQMSVPYTARDEYKRLRGMPLPPPVFKTPVDRSIREQKRASLENVSSVSSGFDITLSKSLRTLTSRDNSDKSLDEAGILNRMLLDDAAIGELRSSRNESLEYVTTEPSLRELNQVKEESKLPFEEQLRRVSQRMGIPLTQGRRESIVRGVKDRRLSKLHDTLRAKEKTIPEVDEKKPIAKEVPKTKSISGPPKTSLPGESKTPAPRESKTPVPGEPQKPPQEEKPRKAEETKISGFKSVSSSGSIRMMEPAFPKSLPAWGMDQLNKRDLGEATTASVTSLKKKTSKNSTHEARKSSSVLKMRTSAMSLTGRHKSDEKSNAPRKTTSDPETRLAVVTSSSAIVLKPILRKAKDSQASEGSSMRLATLITDYLISKAQDVSDSKNEVEQNVVVPDSDLKNGDPSQDGASKGARISDESAPGGRISISSAKSEAPAPVHHPSVSSNIDRISSGSSMISHKSHGKITGTWNRLQNKMMRRSGASMQLASDHTGEGDAILVSLLSVTFDPDSSLMHRRDIHDMHLQVVWPVEWPPSVTPQRFEKPPYELPLLEVDYTVELPLNMRTNARGRLMLLNALRHIKAFRPNICIELRGFSYSEPPDSPSEILGRARVMLELIMGDPGDLYEEYLPLISIDGIEEVGWVSVSITAQKVLRRIRASRHWHRFTARGGSSTSKS